MNLNDLVEFAKAKTIQMMTDIGAGDRASVEEWTRLCTEDRYTALGLMIDGEIVTRTELPDGSEKLHFIMPDHLAVVIFRKPMGR